MLALISTGIIPDDTIYDLGIATIRAVDASTISSSNTCNAVISYCRIADCKFIMPITRNTSTISESRVIYYKAVFDKSGVAACDVDTTTGTACGVFSDITIKDCCLSIKTIDCTTLTPYLLEDIGFVRIDYARVNQGLVLSEITIGDVDCTADIINTTTM